MSGKESSKMSTKTNKKETKKEEVAVKATVHNKATEAAGLHFNVNSTKKWMIKQIKVSDTKVPIFSKSHVALTAGIEGMINAILKAVVTRLPKEPSGLYNISRAAVMYAMQLDSDLALFFQRHLSGFDADTNYTEHFWIPQKEVTKYIEQIHGDNIKLDIKGYNLIAYLLLKFAVVVTKTAHYLMLFAKKNTINGSAIEYSIKINMQESLSNQIIMKLEDALKAYEEDDEEEDDEKESTTKATKDEKSDKKAKAKEESESEESSSSDDSDSESERESESEDEKSKKPAPKKKSK